MLKAVAAVTLILPICMLLAGCTVGSTNQASDITAGAATITGAVAPDGDDYRVRVRYQRADGAGGTLFTAWQTVRNPGTARRTFSVRLTGLAAGTRYRFRGCVEELTGNRPAGKPDRSGEVCEAAKEFTTRVATTAAGFPNPTTTGVPAGWSPRAIHRSAVRVSTPGAVLQDVRIDNANLIIEAPNVTVRRVQIRGGWIDNMAGARCQDGLVVEDSSIEPPPGQNADPRDHWALGQGGFTARRLEMWRRSDGLRVGAKDYGCGPVTVQDSFIGIAPPRPCGDWHGDGIQGYGGGPVIVRNVTIDMSQEGGCGGTAPFFYPHSQGNTSADVDRLLVRGGGYPFRLGMPGSVRGLRIVDGSWSYGPIDVRCSVIPSWEAAIVTITSDFRIASTVRSQPCNTQDGG